MKKLLGTTLALAMFIPAGANAELLKNLKVGGNLDIQTTSARNITDTATRPNALSGGSGPGAFAAGSNNDRVGSAITRVILKLDWDILDDVHSRVTLVKGAEGVAAGAARPYGTAAQSLDGITAATFVQEANVKIDKVFGLVDVTAGRQFYGEEGDLIVYYGPRNAYGLRVDALDIFRADWNGEHMSVTGIAGKTAGGSLAVTPGDTDLRGVIVSCKMHEMVKPSLYVYNRVTHATGPSGAAVPNVAGVTLGKNTNLWVLGTKVKVAAGGFNGSAEIAKNFGEDRTTFAGNANGPQAANFKGYAVQLKAGYKLDLSDIGAINPWGEYGMGTGDSNFAYAGNNTFQSINTDYRPGGIYGRFDTGAAVALTGNTNGNGAGTMASNGLSNRIIWGFGVKATPTAVEKLTVGAAYYRYAYHRVAPTVGGTKSSRNIGSEFDVMAKWKHSENVTLKATAGSFQPGAAIRDVKGANAIVNPAVMLAGDVSIKF